MKENFEEDDSLASEQNETDLIGLVKKMQQQLSYLEKKIDTLIERSSGGGSFRGGDRPQRSFGRPSWQNKERSFHGPRQGGGFHQGRSFDRDRPFEHSGNREFSHERPAFQKSPFGGHRKGGHKRRFKRD